MSTTRVTRHINAPRSRVYAKLIDPHAIAQWKVPDGMTAEVHNFEAREGGKFRISLTYESPDHQGKTSSHTDTYHGHFRELVPDEKVVEIDVFETEDPTMQGEMTITITLEDKDGGTLLTAVHDGLPSGVKPEDNVYGWTMSLGKLAQLLEKA